MVSRVPPLPPLPAVDVQPPAALPGPHLVRPAFDPRVHPPGLQVQAHILGAPGLHEPRPPAEKPLVLHPPPCHARQTLQAIPHEDAKNLFFVSFIAVVGFGFQPLPFHLHPATATGSVFRDHLSPRRRPSHGWDPSAGGMAWETCQAQKKKILDSGGRVRILAST